MVPSSTAVSKQQLYVYIWLVDAMQTGETCWQRDPACATLCVIGAREGSTCSLCQAVLLCNRLYCNMQQPFSLICDQLIYWEGSKCKVLRNGYLFCEQSQHSLTVSVLKHLAHGSTSFNLWAKTVQASRTISSTNKRTFGGTGLLNPTIESSHFYLRYDFAESSQTM